MNIVKFYKSMADESKRLLYGNKNVVNNYNYTTLKWFAALAAVFLLCISVVVFLPVNSVFSRFDYAEICFPVCLGVCIILFLLCVIFPKFSETHSLVLLYIFTGLLNFLALILNDLSNLRIPFSCTLGCMILVPLLVMDTSWRIFIFNFIVIVLSLFESYFTKTFDFFCIDIANTIAFSSVGLVLGDLTRLNHLRYLDAKEHEMDKNMEITNAKSEAKTNFLANMSHEIRTPINAILGLNEMVLRESTEPQVINYSENIRISGKTLLSIINDILDFSKIEDNKLTIYPAEYYLDQTLSDVVNMIRPRAKDKNLNFAVHIDERIPNVLYGDEIRLKQCMLNLLTNAVKYTNEGTVTLSVGWQEISEKSMLLKVRVSDTGVGIREEDMPNLFHAFERIDEKHNRTVEGTGLGMTIVQRLLEKMNSSLNVQSEYGKGSRFSFNLQQEIIRNEAIGNFESRYEKAPAKTKVAYKESFHAPNAKVLVIDDMKINLEVFCGLLKRTQIQIDTALSGAVALEMVNDKHYDMIFIDHRMPLMDGLDTLRLMKRMENNLCKDTPCIALTANAITGAREMYINAGFMDYLSKPVDYVKLEKMLLCYLPEDLIDRNVESASEPSSSGCGSQAAEAVSGAETAGPEEDRNQAFYKAYCNLEKIDASAALQNCSDVEVLQTAVNEYYISIDTKANQIEQFAQQKDYKNYTILVHALKSSSRLIGALKLSEDAKYLEKCGDELNEEEIQKLTPPLLELYRSYKTILSAVVVKKAAVEENSEKNSTETAEKHDERPKMSDIKYKEAVSALNEYAQLEDFITVENIITMIKDCNLSQKQKDDLEMIKKSVENKDKDSINKILCTL